MVLRALSLSGKPREQKKKDGELRLDHEGKGYWHKFSKDSKKAEPKAELKPEPKKEEPKAEKKEPSKPEAKKE